jgi:lysophospholipid acyltransferase (LPLAT)-like uncharacterized protein
MVGRWVAEALASSWRYRVSGEEYPQSLRAAGVPGIYVTWHAQMLPALWRHRGEPMTLLVSAHRDGGKLADAVGAWGYHVVRGSSTRGGANGLLGLTRALGRGETVALTPDGPRGPARIAKPGAITAAQQTGAFILPMAAAASAAWHTGSWDRFLVPRPFSTVRIVYEPPFTVGAGQAGFAEGLRELQASLERASARAECPA